MILPVIIRPVLRNHGSVHMENHLIRNTVSSSQVDYECRYAFCKFIFLWAQLEKFISQIYF